MGCPVCEEYNDNHYRPTFTIDNKGRLLADGEHIGWIKRTAQVHYLNRLGDHLGFNMPPACGMLSMEEPKPNDE